MKYILTIACCLYGIICFGQNSPLNQPAVGISGNDNFTYNTFTVSHYGLGWYYDPQFGPPMAYFSSFGGVKFFTSGVPRGIWDYNGYLGIGTLTPTQKLDVVGDIRLTGNMHSVSPYWFLDGGTGAQTGRIGGLSITANYNDAPPINGLYVQGNVGIGTNAPLSQLSIGIPASMLDGLSLRDGSIVTSAFQYSTLTGENRIGGIAAYAFPTFYSGGVERMRIDNTTGNVGIGTTDTHGYKFAVNGDIHTKKVVVDLINWPDYVFKSTYNLKSLSEVKTYIDLNHHLPEMPSEKEVAEKGVDLGEMNKLLTKKIEELTLYLIEQNKKIEAQKVKIETLENAIFSKAAKK